MSKSNIRHAAFQLLQHNIQSLVQVQYPIKLRITHIWLILNSDIVYSLQLPRDYTQLGMMKPVYPTFPVENVFRIDPHMNGDPVTGALRSIDQFSLLTGLQHHEVWTIDNFQRALIYQRSAACRLIVIHRNSKIGTQNVHFRILDQHSKRLLRTSVHVKERFTRQSDQPLGAREMRRILQTRSRIQPYLAAILQD